MDPPTSMSSSTFTAFLRLLRHSRLRRPALAAVRATVSSRSSSSGALSLRVLSRRRRRRASSNWRTPISWSVR